MKIRSFIFGALSMLALAAGFTSCSDDDNDDAPKPNVELAKTRAFVLDEGNKGNNNAGITYFDWTEDATFSSDLFVAQNKHQLGDVGQDIIADANGNIYVIVSVSRYITKLDKNCVEKATLQMPEELGDPRYGVLDGENLYVTCYGGYIARINTKTMKVTGKVAIGQNPEYIIKENGSLYCTNSGWGSDNRVAKVEIPAFEAVSYYDVMYNPDRIIAVNGHIFVQGYDYDYSYPWGELKSDGTFLNKGQASAWAAYGNTLYLAYSETNWSTYATTTKFYTYDVENGTLNEASPLKNAPEELATASVYSMNVNPYTGDLYITTSDFVNNGKIYHFASDGSFIKKFDSTGLNSRKILFLND